MNATMITKKICLVGDFGVGKTSLVGRFVNHTFSDKYQSTFGVSIKTKIVDEPDKTKLIIWDIAGNDVVTATSGKYLRGADGYVLVVDGTRPQTALAAMHLRQEVEKTCGQIGGVCLLNKADLGAKWRLSESDEIALHAGKLPLFRTSAKTGENVDAAFLKLVSLIRD